MNSDKPPILPVYTTKAQTKEYYNKMSKFYDFLTGAFEGKFRNRAFKKLSIKEAEIVLEVGFGTGHCIKQMASLVGSNGKVFGIDLSTGMLDLTIKRLKKADLTDRVNLCCGDAMNMPYADNMFDAVFMSFTLELFDTPNIPKVLNEIKRTLKTTGRLGVFSLSKEDSQSTLLILYEWAHKKFPKYVDCRPIYLEQSLIEAGFNIIHKEKVSVYGLPGELVIGYNKNPKE